MKSDKKIKICFVQTNSYALFSKDGNLPHGGSEIQLYFLARELAKDNNFEISFVVGDFGQKSVEKKEGVTLFKAKTPKKGENKIARLKQSFSFWKVFKKSDADIYITSSANSLVGLVSMFCFFYKKKHFHRTACSIDVDGTFIGKNGLLGKIYKIGLERANLIFVQNKQDAISLKSNHNKDSFVLKNSFPLEKREHFPKSYILWVARCEKLKNPDQFIALAKKFPNEEFLMISQPRESAKELFDKIKTEISRGNNIRLLESVPFDEIQEYYNKAKLFINTSDFEGFPNTFVQACIGATPIVSLNVNPDNFLTEYDCGFCADGDLGKMYKDIKNILENKEELRIKGENARSYVEKKHDIKLNVKFLKKKIESI